MPKVSVVIPTYKRPEILCRALDSVLKQDYKDYEILIIDDNGKGSEIQLATEELLKKKYKDKRIKYNINEKGLGGGGARNEGIKKGSGEYIAFLDDDEDWLEGKLSAQVKLMENLGDDTGVIDTGFFNMKSGDKVYHSPEMQGWILEDLLAKNNKRAPKLSTMLCRKSALVKAGMFDPEFKSRQDLDLYIKLARNCKFESIDRPYAIKRSDAGERISTSVESKLQGYELLYKKILLDLKLRPKVHADYLSQYVTLLIIEKHFIKALKNLFKMFVIIRFNPVNIIKYKMKIFGKIYKKKIKRKT